MRSLLIVIATCGLPRAAQASEWYAWQTLGADAIAGNIGGRLLLPAVGAGIAGQLTGDDDSCEGAGCGFAGLGMACGMFAATILDAVIAWDGDDDAPDAVMCTIGGGF